MLWGPPEWLLYGGWVVAWGVLFFGGILDHYASPGLFAASIGEGAAQGAGVWIGRNETPGAVRRKNLRSYVPTATE